MAVPTHPPPRLVEEDASALVSPSAYAVATGPGTADLLVIAASSDYPPWWVISTCAKPGSLSWCESRDAALAALAEQVNTMPRAGAPFEVTWDAATEVMPVERLRLHVVLTVMGENASGRPV